MIIINKNYIRGDFCLYRRKKLCFTNSNFINCDECERIFEEYKKSVRPNCIPCVISHAFDEVCDTLGGAYHYENKMYTFENIDYAVKRFIEFEEFDDYCYMKYINIFIDCFSKASSTIGELQGLMLENYKIAIIYLLDILYEDKDSVYNELYQLYLKNKPKSLRNHQIKHKYIGKTSRKVLTKGRNGQDELREVLLAYYGKCNVTGVTLPDFLEVSHSKPWHDCINEEDGNELDVYNTFLLAKHISHAYDQGYISFDDNGKIIISSKLDCVNRKALNINENMNIDLEDGHLKFLRYHRENIFKK